MKNRLNADHTRNAAQQLCAENKKLILKEMVVNKYKFSIMSLAIASVVLAGCGGGDGAPLTSTVAPAAPAAPAGPATPAQTPMDIALTMAQPWMYKGITPEQRAQLLVTAMTLEQKQQQLVGSPSGPIPEIPTCTGGRHVSGITALSIPTLRITNGPVGIGKNDCDNNPALASATALPSAMAIAASFDPSVATEFGNVVGVEGRALALHVFEAPGMNMARLPVLGRNFEYFGEDPYLTGVMGVAETIAVQANGLIAMGKHFVANEQETNRTTVNEIIDDQIMHEIYLKPFEMVVKDAKTAALMCSYNTVNGFQMCENKDLETGVLRNQWGFDGYIQTDFGAMKSTANSMLAGTDHEMNRGTNWSVVKLNAALASGDIQVSDIDTALKRRYTQMFRMGVFDRPVVPTAIDFTAGGVHAVSIGTQSAVLLQNNGALPFAKTVQNVVVVGKATQIFAQQAVAGGSTLGRAMGAAGTGAASSDVLATYTVTPVQGVKNVLSSLGNTTASVKLVLVDDANATATIDGVATTYAAALAATAAADAVIVVAGTISEEGADRATFTNSTLTTVASLGDTLDWYVGLPSGSSVVGGTNASGNSQTTALVTDIMAVTSTTAKSMTAKTALVLKDNAGVTLPAAFVGATAPSILEVWFPGQEDGNITANLLFGVKNPSGKLPVTFPLAGSSFMGQASANMFPGTLNSTGPTVIYEEKLNIGYRWYNAKNITPAFAFGHGLSYTTFNLSGATLTAPTGTDTKYVVKATVANAGAVDGAEVVQVYLGVPSATFAPQPPKRLVAFQKVSVAKGASANVTLTIDPDSSSHPLGVWDKTAQKFIIPTGKYTVYVGNSSDNLTTVGTFTR